MTNSPPIPVTVIAGFLGAGKTTLLNHLLCGCQGKRIAILINDFGSVNLDARLTSGIAKRIIRLANGCICCSIRDELHNVLTSLVDMPDHPDLILIEASAVADPQSIALVCSSPDLRRRVYLDAIITIANAEQISGMTGEIAQMANIQVRAADIILLNKVDRVTPDQLSTARNRLSQLKPGTPVFDVIYCHAPLEILLPGESKYEHLPPQGNVLDTWIYNSREPFQLEALRMVLTRLPETIYRVKGFIYLVNKPKTKFILHVVGKRITVFEGGNWADIPRTRLVFTGSWGDVQVSSFLQEELEACKTSHPDNDSSRTGSTINLERKEKNEKEV